MALMTNAMFFVCNSHLLAAERPRKQMVKIVDRINADLSSRTTVKEDTYPRFSPFSCFLVNQQYGKI